MMTLQKILSLAPEASHPDRKLTTAASANAAEILSALGDTDANTLILKASDLVSKVCRVQAIDHAPATFARQAISETIIIPSSVYPAQRRKLILSMSPAAVSAITIDGGNVDLANVFVSSAGAITFAAASSRSIWPVETPIIITYDAGYVTPVQAALSSPPTGPELPDDLETAVIMTAQHLYALQQREQFDVAAEVEEDSDAGRMETRYFNAGRMGAIPASAMAMLAPYRRLI